MRFLIIGGAGFVGGNLAVYFSNLGHEVLCMDNLSRRGSENNLLRFKKHKNIKFMHGDARNKEDFDRLKFHPDIVLDCSAQTTAIDGYHNPIYDFTNNTLAVINVLEFCRKHRAGIIFWSSNKAYSAEFVNSIPIEEKNERFIWDSSADAVRGWSHQGFNEEADLNGGNHTIYGVTKNAADLLVQEWSVAYGIPAIVNRCSCLYGPYQFGKVSQGWVVWFALAKKFGIDLKFYGFQGKQVRDCLHINDLCDLIDRQSKGIGAHFGSYYNVGGGIENTTSILELSNKLDHMISGEHASVETEEPRRADQKIYISDISKVSDDFGWSPNVSLDVGLKNIIEWLDEKQEDFSWL